MRRFAIPFALVLLVALAGPVSAASQSQTFKGEFQSATFTCSKNTDPEAPVVTGIPGDVAGTWNLNLSNDRTATITVHAWYDGAHHMSTGTGQYTVDVDGTVTMTRGIWTATFHESTGEFTWKADLSAYYECPTDAHSYDALVYSGSAGA